MDKSILRKFAIEARQELMQKMKARLQLLEIDDKKEKKEVGKYLEIQGKLYSKESYRHLLEKYQEIGYEELIEESAYTWFNRLTALAYMESHDYLEEKIITTSILDRYYEASFFENMSSEEQERLHQLRDENTPDSLERMYSILMEERCHDLSKIMPFMFQKKGGYADILFPSGLLLENSLLFRLQSIMEEAKEVEVIGWLYQYYNSEKREIVYDGSMKKSKITKEFLPAATQLFTPEWIVRYIVDNTVGRIGATSFHIPNSLLEKWEYYIHTEKNIASENLNIENLKILDPAMGSGHMLTYAFDLLFDIYQELGWSKKEAVLSILQNNLYGLEIDERAAQLASFAVFMKAREKFPRLFKVIEQLGQESFSLHTLAISESNSISKKTRYFIQKNSLLHLESLLAQFHDAKEYGSILKLEKLDTKKIKEELEELKIAWKSQGQISLLEENEYLPGDIEEDFQQFQHLILQYEVMNSKYDAIVTNPPYMGNARMNLKLKKYTDEHYSNVKSDLFSVFFIKCCEMTTPNGYLGFMSPFVWMFIKSYEELRRIFLDTKTIISLIQLEYSGFEDATVPICTFILQNQLTNKKGEYIKLSDFRGAKNQPIKTLEAIKDPTCSWRYQANQKDFEKIPGSPIAYWVSDRVREIFEKEKKLGDVGEAKQGLATADNNRFLRLWNEVDYKKIGFRMKNSEEALSSKRKWFPYNKGGEKRKWYGNQEYLVNWENDGKEIKNFYDSNGKLRSRPQNTEYYFKKSISWSKISSGKFTMRFFQDGFIFADAGMSLFSNLQLYSLLGIFNSKFMTNILEILSPTLNFEVGHIAVVPIIYLENEKNYFLTNNIIKTSKQEWDSRETSWDFERLSLLDGKTLEEGYQKYCAHWTEQFVQMHKNEEELNKIFLEIYGLQEEMDEKVDFKDITLLKKEAPILEIERIDTDINTPEGYLANRGVVLDFRKEELVKQFLSYAVGCIMGRYSLDKPGIIMANSDDVLVKASNKFSIQGKNGEVRHEIENPRFYPQEFGILSVTDEKVFENDIVTQVIDFVASAYGKESLEANLNFLAEALGKKNESNEEVLRNYFIKDFYTDHLQRYQKRPIYWMLHSGKKNAFASLIYLHRYEENSIARVRTDYLLPYQEYIEARRKYYEAISLDEHSLEKDKKAARKQCKDYDTILIELRDYALEIKHVAEQKISLDLDDGVKVNYEKLGKILKKI